eukprot:21243_5
MRLCRILYLLMLSSWMGPSPRLAMTHPSSFLYSQTPVGPGVAEIMIALACCAMSKWATLYAMHAKTINRIVVRISLV